MKEDNKRETNTGGRMIKYGSEEYYQFWAFLLAKKALMELDLITYKEKARNYNNKTHNIDKRL